MNRPAVNELDRVCVVSVTYRSSHLVDAMARNLAQFNHIVVVDNDSGDATLDLLQARLSKGLYIQNKENVGFGAAMNIAMRKTTSEFALLLNPDCDISADNVRLLTQAADTFSSAMLLGPRILNLHGATQISFDWNHSSKVFPRIDCTPEGPTSTWWLSGCCLLVRVAPFQAMGGFDERFFMYYEEADIGRRAAACGWTCVYLPQALAHHQGDASSRPSWRVEHIKLRHYFRSKRLFLEKHEGLSSPWARQIFQVMIAILMVAVLSATLQVRRARRWIAKAHSLIGGP